MKIIQSVLVLYTDGDSLGFETKEFRHVDGYIMKTVMERPDSPLKALNEGWKLLAPPVKSKIGYGSQERNRYDWWFVRDLVYE